MSGGKCLGGKCPGGFCPVTVMVTSEKCHVPAYNINREILGQQIKVQKIH